MTDQAVIGPAVAAVKSQVGPAETVRNTLASMAIRGWNRQLKKYGC